MLETSASRPVHGDAYGLILEAIDVGIYKPGSRLVESELAERFGVSRTPIPRGVAKVGDAEPLDP
jgi:DNA-binding GntR family transcriptional regulator